MCCPLWLILGMLLLQPCSSPTFLISLTFIVWPTLPYSTIFCILVTSSSSWLSSMKMLSFVTLVNFTSLQSKGSRSQCMLNKAVSTFLAIAVGCQKVRHRKLCINAFGMYAGKSQSFCAL